MATTKLSQLTAPQLDPARVLRAVTVIMGVVVGLTFLFGFGNVLNLALRLGVPLWIAPLVAPAVDLSILGLLLGIGYLSLAGATVDRLRPARRLLIFASGVTLALNVADPLIAGEYGKAAFDAVGPLLLIGWAEVGPGLLQAVAEVSSSTGVDRACVEQSGMQAREEPDAHTARPDADHAIASRRKRARRAARKRSPEELLQRARQEDATHRAAHQRPIAAATLRARLNIGATQARELVQTVRSEFSAQVRSEQSRYEQQRQGVAVG
ncbi:hypothetical protein [Allokutzneria albata]|uniref:DUF2637 domain-containing protein n=1 Tax=Allokutzneria albata TaxID=211114 RepID=A0A1G9WDN2_ALLAB|nr:hypothetical protein [Allokutzneria albata]SDM82599.1 hypothetical protein SAMN04489726_3549 [Allokutzneria albata]